MIRAFFKDVVQQARKGPERGAARLDCQLIFGSEVVVEAAVGRARSLHRFGAPYGIDALRAEHALGRLDDVLPVPGFVTPVIRGMAALLCRQCLTFSMLHLIIFY